MLQRVIQAVKRSQSCGNLARRLAAGHLHRLPPALATRIVHYVATGRWLDLDQPLDFNEKLQWLKLYRDDPRRSRCADKYSVREYIAERGLGRILNELYGVYGRSADIDWNALPRQFVLKCTHGSGYNIFVDDKAQADRQAIGRQLDHFLQEKFGRRKIQPHYDRIPPKIIAERFLQPLRGYFPTDYKLYCFNGRVEIILVCNDRDLEGGLRRDFFDRQWRHLAIGIEGAEEREAIAPPSTLDDMIACAESLSAEFPFVRMDFYEDGERVVFGEMTFTPAACMATYYNDHGLRLLGDMLRLPDAEETR